jgi:hypothetical protein
MSLRFFLESVPGDEPAQGPLSGSQSLSFSIFLSGKDSTLTQKIAVDSAGNCYLAGVTSWNRDFPLLNASQSHFGGDLDVFIVKLNPNGELIFSTFLGGSNREKAGGIAVDDASNCYVKGYTNSSDFPVRNPLQGTINQDYDVFVTKLNATGGVVFSTFLGSDWASDIVVDIDQNCYIAGNTRSNDFPTLNAFQSNFSGSVDGFVTKLNATGNGLIFSTFLGGSDGEDVNAIALDSAGNCHISGDTDSNDFPVVNAYQSSINRGTGIHPRDVFMTKINATGNGLLFSTYLGGDGWDFSRGIAVDNNGNSYIAGFAKLQTNNFAVRNAYQTSPGDPQSGEIFAAKLSVTGTELLFSTFLGGNGLDYARDIAVDASGNSYITGATFCEDFPVVNAYQNSINRVGDLQPVDAFVTKLNATGNGLMFSTFLGGNETDTGEAIAVDKNGNCFVIGKTKSPDFPTNSTFLSPFSGSGNIFVAKFRLGSFTNSSGPRSLIPSTSTKETGLDMVLLPFMMGFGCLSIFRNTRRRNRINSEKRF